jgi:hypothetical protein
MKFILKLCLSVQLDSKHVSASLMNLALVHIHFGSEILQGELAKAVVKHTCYMLISMIIL